MSFRTTFILSLLLLLPSCFVKGTYSVPESWDWGWKPRPYLMRGVPDGDDSYTEGFRDGCSTALSVVAQGLLRSTNAPRYDGWRLTSDAFYSAGFVDGDEHCTYLYDWSIV